ncbi:unnamed protein product [Cunninghamella blakesleeana]
MSVALDPPNQLVFKRPLTEPIEEILYVKNVGNEPIAFKIKTTAPKQYCVRPNSAFIEAGSQVEVQIIFQPFREEPPPDLKCKDKFLVQTAAVKSEWLDWNMIDLWNHIESEYKDTISQNKIRCVFLPPELPQPFLNDESLEDNPPTPTLSHVPSVIETVKDEMTSRQSPPPSPTLVSTLPAIIDAARRASASHPPPKYNSTNANTNIFNDHNNTSSISLLSHHTSRQTPASLNTNTNTNSNSNNDHNNDHNDSSNIISITQVTSLEKTIQEQNIKINKLENDKKLLDQQIVDYKLKQDNLQQQLDKKENEISAIIILKDQLKQTVQSLEKENQQQQQQINQFKLQSIDNNNNNNNNSNNSNNNNNNGKLSSSTVAAHAMQTSPLPIEGYPPQVLLSVSILVFTLTYLFF